MVDEFTRQGLDIRLARSITASDVMRILDELFQSHGRPACLRSDNGPELVSHAVQEWLKDKQVNTHRVEPGSPVTPNTAKFMSSENYCGRVTSQPSLFRMVLSTLPATSGSAAWI